MADSQSLFSRRQGLAPGVVWFVLARQNRDQVLDGPTEHTHGWGYSGILVWSVAILQYRVLERVRVQFTIRSSIVCDESFDCLYPNFCSTVAMWEGNGGEAMVNAPVCQELPGRRGSKFRTTV